MKTYDFKVGDKIFWLNGGLIYTGKIAEVEEYGCYIEPTFNGAKLPNPWQLHEYIFPRPDSVEDLIRGAREYVRSVEYDIERIRDSYALASDINTISTGFTDVLLEGSGEGTARCGKCRHRFEFSIYTSEGLTWNDNDGRHQLECPECAKTAPIE